MRRPWLPITLGAMAGGLGWGIRGQYGHETGAMIAGALVGLTLVFLFCSQAESLAAARATAWCTIAIGFGGSMTYAQTIGLTHDPALVGNWAALRWGMLGLALKGAIWIGFAGVFLGMGLSGIRYRPGELFGLMGLSVALYLAGTRILNEPFDPAHQVLPKIYFSADWRWQPGANLKPRREDWGGLLFALVALIVYAAWRRDRLALFMGGWGIAGGALGFPLGQCLQAFHAWNADYFHTGFWTQVDPVINWWNMMETTFGAVMGAMLGFGLWLHRARIALAPGPAPVVWPRWVEWSSFVAYLVLLGIGEFRPIQFLDPFTDLGLAMGILPVVAVAAGRWWPYLLLLPATALPIAGKTLRELAYRQHALPESVGWLIYVCLPMLLMFAAAIWFGRRPHALQLETQFLPRALILCAWVYFGLNFAFFRFPWPWSTWTYRTPNAVIYTICAIGLTLGASRRRV